MANIESELEILREREQEVRGHINKFEDDLNKLNTEEKELKKREKRVKRAFKKLNDNVANFEQEKERINNELEQIREEMREARVLMAESDEYTRNKALLSQMQKLYDGIYGTLADLVSPKQNKYKHAVNVALGINYDSVVVENTEVAMKCIEYMKTQKKGHRRFIPLNSIKVSPISQEMRRLGGTAQPAMDVIDYNKKHERAVLYSMGNTVVVENIDEARRLAFPENNNNNNNGSQPSQGSDNSNNGNNSNGNGNGGDRWQRGLRYVTYDGTVIAPNGNITGGSSRVDNFDQRSNIWDQKKFQEKGT